MQEPSTLPLRPSGMRRLLVLMVISTSLFAQPRPSRRPGMQVQGVGSAELAVKQAAERLVNTRKGIELGLKVLQHIRASDRALIDPMQPSIAVQKAFEEISEAERLNPSPQLAVGIIRARQTVDAARKSPASADFGRLRATIREDALGPVQRQVVRAATQLHDETMAWLAVQELISTHLKSLADITGEGLRAADE